jgi:hypothetical protein
MKTYKLKYRIDATSEWIKIEMKSNDLKRAVDSILAFVATIHNVDVLINNVEIDLVN